MKILEISGVEKSNEVIVTKSIGSLIVVSSRDITQLTNEKISVYIERANGANVSLANKIPLKDFILLSTYGTDACQSDASINKNLICLCELSHHGSIFLEDKESIRITMEDLDSQTSYELYGVAEPELSKDLYFFEQKTVASEEFEKIVDVSGNDLAVMTKDVTINDVSYHFINGQVVKYLPIELQTLSRDVDPILAILKDGSVVQGLGDRITLPLNGVRAIEINKNQGAVINFVVRTLKSV